MLFLTCLRVPSPAKTRCHATHKHLRPAPLYNGFTRHSLTWIQLGLFMNPEGWMGPFTPSYSPPSEWPLRYGKHRVQDFPCLFMHQDFFPVKNHSVINLSCSYFYSRPYGQRRLLFSMRTPSFEANSATGLPPRL